MPKSEELQKVTMNLYAGDYGKLQELYPDVGAAVIIRRIVRKYLEQIDSTEVDTNVQVEL